MICKTKLTRVINSVCTLCCLARTARAWSGASWIHAVVEKGGVGDCQRNVHLKTNFLFLKNKASRKRRRPSPHRGPRTHFPVVRAENRACTLPSIDEKKTISDNLQRSVAKIKPKPTSNASHHLGLLHRVCARLSTVLTTMDSLDRIARERLSRERPAMPWCGAASYVRCLQSTRPADAMVWRMLHVTSPP